MEKGSMITGETTVYDAVTAYPELKEVLIRISPKYKKLQNPVIFNTVAKITPLKKAAAVGGIFENELLLQLNEAIGKKDEYLAFVKSNIPKMQEEFLKKQFGAAEGREKPRPEWMSDTGAYEVIDGRKFDEPFPHVVKKAGTLKSGEGFVLVQKFEPAPMISYLEQQGFESFTEKISGEEYRVYFRKRQG